MAASKAAITARKIAAVISNSDGFDIWVSHRDRLALIGHMQTIGQIGQLAPG
jgi:hypothetical protein